MAIESKEKEPAPAATDTSSEFETCENVSACSISENAENVKRKIPQAVLDALDDEIFRLEGFINEDSKHISNCQSKINDIDNFVKQFGGAEND